MAEQTNTQKTGIPILLLRAIMTLFTPLLLIMIGVRLVMTPVFLHIEYTRPGFPTDFYGFTEQDRLKYAPYALDYLLNGEDITFLGDLTFDNGQPLFNARELQHMLDVKVVTQWAFLIAVIAGILWLIGSWWLSKHHPNAIRAILRSSANITIGLIVAVVVLAVFAWDTFFVGFHKLFFSDGTWQFPYSDTLIRLFPEQFWFDAALAIGGFTLLSAIGLYIASFKKQSQ